MSRYDNSVRRRPENHERQRLLTPSYVVEPIREHLGGSIDLDPCTEPDNPVGARLWISPPEDGATSPWGDARTVFCNPPYGEARERWVDRCVLESKLRGRRVVLLIPAHTETRVFQNALRACDTVLLVRSRLRFGVPRENGRQEAASHGSALFGFGVDLTGIGIDGTVLRRVA